MHFIFIVRSTSVNRKNNLFLFLEKNGTVNIEKEADKNDWYRFVTSFFKKEKLAITPEAVEELISRVADLGSFLNEAEKTRSLWRKCHTTSCSTNCDAVN